MYLNIYFTYCLTVITKQVFIYLNMKAYFKCVKNLKAIYLNSRCC